MRNVSQSEHLGLISLSLWAIRYAFRRWADFGLVLLSLVLGTALEVVKPWPMIFLIGYVLKKQTRPIYEKIVALFPSTPTVNMLIFWSVAGTVLIFLLSWAVGLLNAYASISLGQRITYDMAADVFAKLQHLSLRFHTRARVGDNIRRMTVDSTCVSVIVKDALLPVVSSVLTLVSTLLIMWKIDPILTLIAVAVVPYMALVFRFYAQPMIDRS